MTKAKPITLGIFVACAVACGPELEPFSNASVELQWRVAPMGCQAAGVEQVEARLENAQRTITAVADCATGELTVDEVAPGSYRLTLDGLDASGDAVFRGGAPDLLVRPHHGVSVDPIDLTARPGVIDIAWSFDNRRSCDENRVHHVDVIAYDATYHPARRVTTSCADGFAVLESLAPGEYLVVLEASGPSEHYQAVTELKVARGAESRARVGLVELEEPGKAQILPE